jgi:hypothetical protein
MHHEGDNGKKDTYDLIGFEMPFDVISLDHAWHDEPFFYKTYGVGCFFCNWSFLPALRLPLLEKIRWWDSNCNLSFMLVYNINVQGVLDDGSL